MVRRIAAAVALLAAPATVSAQTVELTMYNDAENNPPESDNWAPKCDVDEKKMGSAVVTADGTCKDGLAAGADGGTAPDAAAAYCDDANQMFYFDFGGMAASFQDAAECQSALADPPTNMKEAAQAGAWDGVAIPYSDFTTAGDCVLVSMGDAKLSFKLNQFCPLPATTPAPAGATTPAPAVPTPEPPQTPCQNGLQPSGEQEHDLTDLGLVQPNADQPTTAAACQAKFDEVEATFCPGSERSQWLTQYTYSAPTIMCWLICCPKPTPAPPVADTPAPAGAGDTPAPAGGTPADTPAPAGGGGDTTPAPGTPGGGGNGGGGDPSTPPAGPPATPRPTPPPCTDPAGCGPNCGINGYSQGSGPDGAVMMYDCCTCYRGYKLTGPKAGPDQFCIDCAEGYVMSATGMCTDGRPGSDCADGDAPPFGCGGGTCSKDANGRKVFPCATCSSANEQGDSPAKLDAQASSCQFYARENSSGDIKDNVNDGMAGADNTKAGGCLPTGPRMMAPFPYHPLTGIEANGVKPFTLNIVGCDITDNDTFLVIPAFQWDADDPEGPIRANLCEELGVPPNAVPMPTLAFNVDTKDDLKVVDADGAQDGTNGFICQGCAKKPNTDQAGMVELVIEKLQYTEPDSLGKCACAPDTVSQGPGGGGAAAGHKAKALARRAEELGKKKKKWGSKEKWGKGKGGKTGKKGKLEMNEDENCPCDEIRHYRRMCWYAGLRKDVNGEDQPLYRTIDAHNLYGWEGSTRYPAFYIGKSFEVPSMQPMMRGAAMGENALPEGDACCEGLLIGGEIDSPCLPLWLFILIWLLLCLLLALLACALHKNQKDIEAEKNNLKFSNFATDKELEEAGAGEGDDDDI